MTDETDTPLTVTVSLSHFGGTTVAFTGEINSSGSQPSTAEEEQQRGFVYYSAT